MIEILCEEPHTSVKSRICCTFVNHRHPNI